MTRTRTRSGTNDVQGDEEELDGSCMSVVVETNNWILEQLKDGRTSPPARSCYWMMLESSAGELLVSKNEFPDNSRGDQVFRLSFLSPASASASTSATGSGVNKSQTPPPSHALEVDSGGVSTKVGTKLLFYDDKVCIWEFRIQPQERCQYHRHLRPYVYFNLTESLTQELDKEGKAIPSPPRRQLEGQSTFVTVDQLGEHAVHNVGDGVFLQFIVEFL